MQADCANIPQLSNFQLPVSNIQPNIRSFSEFIVYYDRRVFIQSTLFF